MSNFVVSDTNQLLAALKAATAGDVVRLRPGEYASFTLQSLDKGGPVTITSDEPDNPAVLTGFRISNAKDLTLTDLRLVPATQVLPFQVLNSSDVTLTSLHIHGTLNGDTSDDGGGVFIRNSRDVTVSNSKFEQLRHALSHQDNDGLVIEGNSFTDIREDGIRGGGSSNVLVKNNLFRDFFPIGEDHADAIQFWTTNTTKIAVNIVVEGNVILRGSGVKVQGIFMRDETTRLPYEQVQIKDNFLYGAGYNAIMLDGKNSTISGNNVLVPPGEKAWIRVNSSYDVKIEGNLSHMYSVPGWSVPAERTAVSYDGGRSALLTWLADKDLLSFPAALFDVPGFEGIRPVADAPAPPVAEAPMEEAVVEICPTPQGDTESGAPRTVSVYASRGDEPVSPIGPSAPSGGEPSPSAAEPALRGSARAAVEIDAEAIWVWSPFGGVQLPWLRAPQQVSTDSHELVALFPKLGEGSVLAEPAVYTTSGFSPTSSVSRLPIEDASTPRVFEPSMPAWSVADAVSAAPTEQSFELQPVLLAVEKQNWREAMIGDMPVAIDLRVVGVSYDLADW